MSDLPTNDQIKIGSKVAIETKEDQGTGKLTEGIVKTKLTSSNTHPHGIKVELEDGNVGRVKKLLSDLPSESKTNSQTISKIDVVIAKEEDSSNELKSSFRADIDRLTKGDGKIVSSKSVEKEISITISAIANKDGGQLFIGIDDKGNVLGLDADYELLKNPSDDKFQRIIWQSIENYLGNMTFVSKLDMMVLKKNSKKICFIKIPKSSEPIFVNDNNNQESYVRVGSRSEKFSPQEFMKYCKTRFEN